MKRKILFAKWTFRSTSLRLWAFLTAGLLGAMGFAGCCNQPALKYGIVPLYGPVQLEDGSPAIEQIEPMPDSPQTAPVNNAHDASLS